MCWWLLGLVLVEYNVLLIHRSCQALLALRSSWILTGKGSNALCNHVCAVAKAGRVKKRTMK